MEYKGSSYWKKLRDQALNWDEEAHGNTASKEISCLSTHFVAFKSVITKYVSGLTSIDEDDKQMGDPTLQPQQHEKSDEEKGVILETRHALRYILTLLSQESRRMHIQEEAVCIYELHTSICSLLSTEHCDKKCQIMAAKILCNLGTCNRTTSLTMLNDIKASPNSIFSNIDSQNEKGSKENDAGEVYENYAKHSCVVQVPSWGEMIHVVASTGEREALGIIVASIHNYILAGTSSKDLNEHEENTSDSYRRFNSVKDFDISTYVMDKILMCNLVRYILPKDTITSVTTVESDKDKSEREKDMSDDATSWIVLLVELLCRHGMFPQIYNSLGFNRNKNVYDAVNEGNENCIKKGIITPEQVVLINCFSDSIETYAQKNSGKNNGFRGNPLGGIAGKKAIKATVYFLAEKWLELQQSIHLTQSSTDLIDNELLEEYQGETSCIIHAGKLILDILGTSLSCCYDGGSEQNSNDTCFASIRLHLGQNTALLTNALLALGVIVDRLEIENRGVKARELVISQNDQHCITGLVRLIGNLSHRCKPNQDLVRETFVPAPANEQHIIETTPKSDIKTERNGLHVILSCTSFSYGCFTLREWGIVAIRNILEGNISNQDEVAKLEAQQVINTPELEKFGINLNLDKKGKVVVNRNNQDLNSEEHG